MQVVDARKDVVHAKAEASDVRNIQLREATEQIAVLNVKLEVIVAEICQSMLVWI